MGDWKKGIEVPLKGALSASIDIVGKSGEKACRQAIIFIAQSAKRLTPKSKKNRKVERDSNGLKFLEAFNKDGERVKWYLPRSNEPRQFYDAELSRLRPIKNQGLAQRSWLWGLRRLKGAPKGSKPIPGVARFITVKSQSKNGYVLEDRLDYILKILPAGWRQTVEQKVSARIMGLAARKMERDLKRTHARRQRATLSATQSVTKYFLKA